MHIAKLASYEGLGVIDASMWVSGLTLGPVMIVGTYTGKKILTRIPPDRFVTLIDSAIVAFGVYFLFR